LLSGRCVYDRQQLAQGGFFVVVSGPKNYIVRRSDGQVYAFENAPQRRTWFPLQVSQSEYWSIESIPFGADGVALTRLTLPAW
jgi:hypothetical protein